MMNNKMKSRLLSIAVTAALAVSMAAPAFAEEASADRASVLYDRTTLHDGYDSTPLEEDVVEALLDAGFSAPTGGNQRSIEFFPVTDREMLDAIAEVPGFFSGVASAPLAVIVSGNEDTVRYPELEEMDSGLAAMAMIVKATDLGLSSCVMSISPQEERVNGISEILGMTENYLPILLVAFGYPSVDATSSASVNNYDAAQVHTNGLEEDYVRSIPEEGEEAELAEGDVYTASAQGISSPVTVTLVVNGGEVADLAIDASGETPELGGAAAETIQAQILESGSLEFDTVTGATITSDAIAQALADAAAEAGLN